MDASKVTLEPIETVDPFLESMLFEAAAIHPHIYHLGKTKALETPEMRRYLDDWGREGDHGFIATDEYGIHAGAAFSRMFGDDTPGFGYLKREIPEIVVGVLPDRRNHGIGSVLLMGLGDCLEQRGFPGMSTVVPGGDHIKEFYEHRGFADAGIEVDGDHVIMVKYFSD